MITVQGKGFNGVQDLVSEIATTRPDFVWRNAYVQGLHQLNAGNAVLTDYDDLAARLEALASAAPANELYDVSFELLELFTKPASAMERSAAKGFSAKAKTLSTLEPRRVVLRNLAAELEKANAIDGQIVHFEALRREDLQHVAVLNKINDLTARIIKTVVFYWNDDQGGGAQLMSTLGRVGFVHVLFEWVTGKINCNMNAGSKLRGACDKVECTMKA
ncbi:MULTISPECIES: hypothetical protein [Nonomuraea]|jgi:hypothetical protein|uniref:Uncharacterized protein n=1 Tax=Nonomuraea salmonea TaxID=46181 RepID=A0ABV5NW07_9ACTN